jgi:hypothetical protein
LQNNRIENGKMTCAKRCDEVVALQKSNAATTA